MERGRMGTASLALAVGSCNVADGTMAAGRAANRIWRIDWMRGGRGGLRSLHPRLDEWDPVQRSASIKK